LAIPVWQQYLIRRAHSSARKGRTPELVTVGVGIGIGIAIAIRAKGPVAIATPMPIRMPNFGIFRLILGTGLELPKGG
jgi:hypothetical protein